MSALVKIQKEADKEVFAVKLGETYVAVVNDDDNFYFLPDLYKSPLVACNAARSEKRKNSIVRNVKKKVNGVELKKPTKIAKVKPLYTEEEMSSRPHLKFRGGLGDPEPTRGVCRKSNRRCNPGPISEGPEES
jgi:hypothetical protein